MHISQHELATIQRMVSMTNALIELQRELIEHLNDAGCDVAVATRDFEDLMLGLAGWVQQRQQLSTRGFLPKSGAA